MIRMNDADIADALRDLKTRIVGLEATIRGSTSFARGDERDAVLLLATEISDSIKSLCDGFEDERQLRVAESVEAGRRRRCFFILTALTTASPSAATRRPFRLMRRFGWPFGGFMRRRRPGRSAGSA